MVSNSALDLFSPQIEVEKQHPIFQRLLLSEFAPERDVLLEWSRGFVDRDGKFIKEFQSSFESSMWELYVFACLKELGAKVDFQYAAPDFVCDVGNSSVCVEATITQPPIDGAPAYGPGPPALPDNFDEFNVESTLRHCTRFAAKSQKYLDAYSALEHVKDKPFVIALAPFDRPAAHLASNRPIIAALYGVYFDEELTISTGAERVIQWSVDGVVKSPTANVSAAYFTNPRNAHVSAVLYSPIATWGKIRALADAPMARTIYTTLHPNPISLQPVMRRTQKLDYVEHLLDGLYVFHNPYAMHPLPPQVFSHERIAQLISNEDGTQDFVAPDDFLLMRILHSVGTA